MVPGPCRAGRAAPGGPGRGQLQSTLPGLLEATGSSGMNKSQYARHRGVDESTVRQALREGRIVAAIDGTIDPELADRMWAENSARGQRSGAAEVTTLADARRRKMLASIAALEDEVSE